MRKTRFLVFCLVFLICSTSMLFAQKELSKEEQIKKDKLEKQEQLKQEKIKQEQIEQELSLEKKVAPKEELKLLVPECHHKFAVEFNSYVWKLLTKEERTEKDDELMVLAANASCLHWIMIGQPINQQRGHWLLSRVYTVLNKAALALEHAEKCYLLTEEFKFDDFDLAYSYEAMARALALSGNMDKAQKFYSLAIEQSNKIKDEEDKKYFMGDFETGNWFGLESDK